MKRQRVSIIFSSISIKIDWAYMFFNQNLWKDIDFQSQYMKYLYFQSKTMNNYWLLVKLYETSNVFYNMFIDFNQSLLQLMFFNQHIWKNIDFQSKIMKRYWFSIKFYEQTKTSIAISSISINIYRNYMMFIQNL